jgi:hypothetical protein
VGVAVCEQRLGAHFVVASHAMTRGCIVDEPLYVTGALCVIFGGLLSVGAALTGLISVIIRDRARGGYLVMGIAAVVIGVIGGIVCFVMFGAHVTPHAIPPQYLPPC